MNECHSWVYEPRRSKKGSSKEIVGECKYIRINTPSLISAPTTFLWGKKWQNATKNGFRTLKFCILAHICLKQCHFKDSCNAASPGAFIRINTVHVFFRLCSNTEGVFGPCHEKTCFCHMWTTKAHPCSLISFFVVYFLDSIIPLVSISKVSSL